MSGVTKDAGPASCAVVASQWAGGAERENEVLFSVFFTGEVLYPSSSYQYGNPGFYYDPIQFPVFTETQTSPPYVSYPSTVTRQIPPPCVSHVQYIPDGMPTQGTM